MSRVHTKIQGQNSGEVPWGPVHLCASPSTTRGDFTTSPRPDCRVAWMFDHLISVVCCWWAVAVTVIYNIYIIYIYIIYIYIYCFLLNPCPASAASTIVLQGGLFTALGATPLVFYVLECVCCQCSPLKIQQILITHSHVNQLMSTVNMSRVKSHLKVQHARSHVSRWKF